MVIVLMLGSCLVWKCLINYNSEVSWATIKVFLFQVNENFLGRLVSAVICFETLISDQNCWSEFGTHETESLQIHVMYSYNIMKLLNYCKCYEQGSKGYILINLLNFVFFDGFLGYFSFVNTISSSFNLRFLLKLRMAVWVKRVESDKNKNNQ